MYASPVGSCASLFNLLKGGVLRMKFNTNQKNGLATVLDNIGTAIFIALIVGIFIESKILFFPGLALVVLAIVNIGTALLLRRKK